MKAVVVRENGARLEEKRPPAALPNEVLVEVKAAALNRLDLQVSVGATHGKVGGIGNTMGIEWSGVVLQVGSEVPVDLQPGDRVMCSGAGGYAEIAVTDWGRVHKLPEAFSDFVQAAALPVSLQTAHEALSSSGRLARGDAVLVNGAGSAIGIMTIQVARELGASLVIGTTTAAGKIDRLKALGVNLGVSTAEVDWHSEVLEATGGRGADLTIDMVAGPTVNALLAATRIGGRIVNVGRVGGLQSHVDLDLHAMRRIHYVGASFRTRTLDEVRDISLNMRRDLWGAVERGSLQMPVAEVFSIDRFAEALAAMKSNSHFGKIVLKV